MALTSTGLIFNGIGGGGSPGPSPSSNIFTSTEVISGAIGDLLTSLDLTLVDSIPAGTTLLVGNTVIFSNGIQLRVTAIDTVNDEYSGVIVSIPIATAWGAISGDIENQVDLINLLDTKENILTAGDNINIDRTNPLSPIISVTGISVNPADLISTDADNYLVLGTDGKLFVQAPFDEIQEVNDSSYELQEIM